MNFLHIFIYLKYGVFFYVVIYMPEYDHFCSYE